MMKINDTFQTQNMVLNLKINIEMQCVVKKKNSSPKAIVNEESLEDSSTNKATWI